MENLLKNALVVVTIVGPLIGVIWFQFNSRIKKIEEANEKALQRIRDENEKALKRVDKRVDKIELDQQSHNERMYEMLKEIKEEIGKLNVEGIKTYVCKDDCERRHKS